MQCFLPCVLLKYSLKSLQLICCLTLESGHISCEHYDPYNFNKRLSFRHQWNSQVSVYKEQLCDGFHTMRTVYANYETENSILYYKGRHKARSSSEIASQTGHATRFLETTAASTCAIGFQAHTSAKVVIDWGSAPRRDVCQSCLLCFTTHVTTTACLK